MHHAPQNIPNNKHSNSLVQSLANNLVTGGENKILSEYITSTCASMGLQGWSQIIMRHALSAAATQALE
jgi:hypothetical protein